MRTSLGQNRQLPEHAHGLVMTVMVATPEEVRRGFIRQLAKSAASCCGVTFQLFQSAGSFAFTFR